MSSAWISLVIAGLFEVVWAVGLKYTAGFTKLAPSVLTLAAMLVSFYLLALSLKTLPVGTGYAVWTGIGAVGTALAGIWLLGEPRDLPRLLSIALIVGGIIALKLTTPG
jgi:quaternary ammonium compound-resistance protein SugE